MGSSRPIYYEIIEGATGVAGTAGAAGATGPQGATGVGGGGLTTKELTATYSYYDTAFWITSGATIGKTYVVLSSSPGTWGTPISGSMGGSIAYDSNPSFSKYNFSSFFINQGGWKYPYEGTVADGDIMYVTVLEG